MEELSEIKIDEKTENCFNLISKKNFKNIDENVEKLDSKFCRMTFEDLKKKVKYKYPVKVSENLNFLSVSLTNDNINRCTLSFFPAIFIFMLLSIFINFMQICRTLFKSFENNSNFFFIYLGFIFLSILFIAFLIFLLLKKINFGYFETKFDHNKFQILKGNKITEKILSQNTRFFVKEYTGQIFFYDKETEVEIPLFGFRENYVTNYLAYKMNKYILNQLKQN